MKKRRFSKPIISQKEYSDIVSTGEASRKILQDPTFKFLRDYLENAKQSIIDLFVENRIKEVHHTIPEGEGQKTMIKTREEEEYELSGQYKFVQKLLSDLETNVKLPDQLLEAFENKKIIIEHLTKKK